MDKSATACEKFKSWSKNGGNTTTQTAHIVFRATALRPQKPSS